MAQHHLEYNNSTYWDLGDERHGLHVSITSPNVYIHISDANVPFIDKTVVLQV